jgi:putative heme iron utilization protein
MLHDSRLTRELRALLHSRRVGALGTLSDDGLPFVSMVPFAMEPQHGELVLHVSALAEHSRNLTKRPQVTLLVMQGELPGEPVHALQRVTLSGLATVLDRGSEHWTQCRNAYLARFPEAEPMTEMGDFSFVAVQMTAARQIAGFGAARGVDAEEVRRAMQAPAPSGH